MHARRTAALTLWCFLVWVLLTWTATVEFLVVGALVALACATVLAPLGDVMSPGRLLRPRRLLATARLAVVLGGRVVAANLRMARRVWLPDERLRTGMVEVPTRMRGEAGLGAAGLLSSLVVDNQLVDLDPSHARMLYHCIDVPSEEDRDEVVNGWLEKRLQELG